MSKYEPLGKYLKSIGKKYIDLTFMEVENILSFELPYSLYKYPQAWYGTGEKSPTHVWKVVWYKYGYQVDYVELDKKKVRFYKV
jgi:hypothetical protein